MHSTMAERHQNHETLETPSHRLITSIGWIEANWTNANLIRHYDPYENYLEHNDGEALHKLNVLDDDWEKLAELNFPWEYWPDLSRFEEDDFIQVNLKDESYQFRPRDSKLRLFPKELEKYNHVEHQLDPQHIRGMRVSPALWRLMFKGDYPLKYLPYLDRASKEWAAAVGV